MENNTQISVSLLSSPERILSQIASLEDHELLKRIGRLVERECFATASLVAHLAEMDRRRLHLGLGYSSLFNYCTQALHLSEHAAYKRIESARAARRFPALLARLAEGALHLSAIVLLAPVLNQENHEALIEEARHKTKRQVEEIVARVRPAGPVPSLVQKVPALPARPIPVPDAPPVCTMAETDRPAPVIPPGLPLASPPALPAPPPPRPILAPLAPGSYRVQFTAGAEMHDRLLKAQALLRHQVPDGDIARILDLALVALLKKTEARKFGKRKVGRRPVARTADRRREKSKSERNETRDVAGPHEVSRERTRSRYIPAEVRREVWERDQGRCTFTGADGVRCTDTSFLEFDHREPHACGGPATVANIRLLCRRHNLHLSRLRFGPDTVREASPSYGNSPHSACENGATRPGASSPVAGRGVLFAAGDPFCFAHRAVGRGPRPARLRADRRNSGGQGRDADGEPGLGCNTAGSPRPGG